MITGQMEFDRSKAELRERMKKVRDEIPADTRAAEDEMLTRIILGTELYEAAAFILTYVSFGTEADTKALILQALRDGKKVYVPYVFPKSKTMDFFQCEDLGRLKRNRLGILEPEPDPTRLFPYTTHISLDAAENCMILVPGLAFDTHLGRIGYGGGYYDRYLGKFRKKMSVGMAYNEQIVDEVPMGQNDIPLDLVVTPQQAYF